MPNFAKNFAAALGSHRAPSPPSIATNNVTVTAATAYAVYVGRFDAHLSSFDLLPFVRGTVAVGAGWGEVALARGVYTSLAGSTNLTILGYADIEAETKIAATRVVKRTLTGLNIPAGTDLWAIVACSHATTQASFQALPTDFWGYARIRANCRPSANLNTPLAFTNGLTGTVVPPDVRAEPIAA